MPAHLAPVRSVFALVIALLGAWPAAAADANTRLADAARARDMALVRRLLQQPGIDVNAPGQDGTPALHWAVRVNDVETAAALIRAGADPKRPNRYGLLPLSLAAQNANAAMIRLLAESGADANAPDAAGEAPLVTATGLGSLDAVQALIAAGAVVDAKDKTFQQTALMVAVRANHPPLVTLFLDKGADVNARTRTGETPRWVLPNSVPGFGHGVGIVRGGLPERGSRPPIPGAMTPLLYAARDGRIESAKLLLERGAAIDAADANGITPLLTAISNNHPAMALLLIERGANVRAVDWYGRTPLWAAVEARNMDVDNATFVNSVDRAPLLPVIEALLAKGVDVNARMLEHPPIRRHMLPITGTLAWVDFTGQTAVPGGGAGCRPRRDAAAAQARRRPAHPHLRRHHGVDGRGGRELGGGSDLRRRARGAAGRRDAVPRAGAGRERCQLDGAHRAPRRRQSRLRRHHPASWWRRARGWTSRTRKAARR